MNLKTVLINENQGLFVSSSNEWRERLKEYEDHFTTIGYEGYLSYVEKRIDAGWCNGTYTYAIQCKDSGEVKAFFELSHVLPGLNDSYLKILGIRMCPTIDSRAPLNGDGSEMDRLKSMATIANKVLSESLKLAENTYRCGKVKILSTKQVDKEFFANYSNNIDQAKAKKLGFDIKHYNGGMWLEVTFI